MGVEGDGGGPGPFVPVRAPFWNPRFLRLLAFAAVAGTGALQVLGRLNGPFLAILGSFFAVGFVLGAVHPGRAWLFGIATVSLVPVAIAVEIACDRTSHNLLPFELVIDAFLLLPGALGAAVGGLVRRDAGRPEDRDLTARGERGPVVEKRLEGS